jgi:hypothetical protein
MVEQALRDLGSIVLADHTAETIRDALAELIQRCVPEAAQVTFADDGELVVATANGHPLTPDAVATLEALGGPVAVVLANAETIAGLQRLNDQLHEALLTRDTIGQAKGILMNREGCSADEAFDILRRASQRLNQKLHDVAADIVRGAEQNGG